MCLAITHTSIFNTPRQAFFWWNQRVRLFCVIGTFLPVIFFKFIVLNHYGILASTVIDINCENELS